MKTAHLRLIAPVLWTLLAIAAPGQTPASPYVIEFAATNFEGREVRGLSLILNCTPPIRTGETKIPQIRVRTTDITAQRGSDYQFPAEGRVLKLAFDQLGYALVSPDGQTQSWYFYIPVVDDGVPEPDESFEVRLTDPGTNAVVGVRSSATVTIHNSLPSLQLQIVPDGLLPDPFAFTVGEDFGATRPLLEVIRRGEVNVPVSAELSFTGGVDPNEIGLPGPVLAAVPGVNFVAVNQRIEFAAGETSRRIIVPILNDGVVGEVGETQYFTATLSHQSAGADSPGPLSVGIGIKNREISATLDVTKNPNDSPMILLEGTTNDPQDGTYQVPSDFVNFLTLPGGKKLVAGSFTLVNDVRRPGLARLDANDELDEGFLPPEGLSPVNVGFRFLQLPTFRLLQSGALLVPNQEGHLVLLKSDGSRDTSFPEGLTHAAQAHDGSLWGVRSNRVLHLTAGGVVLSSREIPARSPGETIFDIQSEGQLLVRKRSVDPEDPIGRWETIQRWLPNGSNDPAFEAIRYLGEAGVLQDGRLVTFNLYSFGRCSCLRVFTIDGRNDASFPSPHFDKHGDGSEFYTITQNGDRLRVSSFILNRVSDVNVEPGTYQFFLSNAPTTALQLTSSNRYGYGFFGIEEPKSTETGAFFVTFRRLGQTTQPATATFTTQDLSATAGKDYVAQSGVVSFAPFEVEKTIEIRILANSEIESSEALEVVVTGGGGFEALPTPLRLAILKQGDFRGPPPPSRIKRLGDGRVLVGLAQYTSVEVSEELKRWERINGWENSGSSYPLIFIDENAKGHSSRFYRLVWP